MPTMSAGRFATTHAARDLFPPNVRVYLEVLPRWLACHLRPFARSFPMTTSTSSMPPKTPHHRQDHDTWPKERHRLRDFMGRLPDQLVDRAARHLALRIQRVLHFVRFGQS